MIKQPDNLEEEKEIPISELLINWNNIKVEKQKIEVEEDKVRNKIKAFLKERKWNKYLDEETNISVSITENRRETIDKVQLKMLLGSNDYNSVIKTTVFEKLNILTKGAREKIKKFIR